jgi:hypothetical protein
MAVSLTEVRHEYVWIGRSAFPGCVAGRPGHHHNALWTLWSFTNHSFPLVRVAPVTINFTRAQVDTPLDRKERVKPERRVIEDRVIDLPPIGSTTTSIDSRVD